MLYVADKPSWPCDVLAGILTDFLALDGASATFQHLAGPHDIQ
jgi:hypothetical protein